MADPQLTCWTVIDAAAAGSVDHREEFARRYSPVIRAYLAARWRCGPCLGDMDDAVQEVFLACFQPGGVLQRADRDRGFRAFLFGVVRNVALRIETSRGRRRERQPLEDAGLEQVPDDAESLSRAFDRAWAKTLLREAAGRMEQRARDLGEAACRRVELLRLRFHQQLPIREIAVRWGVEAADLHHEYAKARREFKAALREVVAFHRPGSESQIDQECADLLSLL